ncbi:hypothetical protein DSQ20_02795 [Nitrosarchaeum sp. AC2]|nr:hypothetical protein DSQ20_02795 [Nitrosarchaeum sp. AC2]
MTAIVVFIIRSLELIIFKMVLNYNLVLIIKKKILKASANCKKKEIDYLSNEIKMKKWLN